MTILDRRRLPLLLMLVAALGLLLPATAMAQNGQRQGERGQGHFTSPRHLMQIADELELREEQREGIAEILQENRESMHPLRQQLREESRELRDMMGDMGIEREEIFEQLQKVLEIESQVKTQRTGMMLDVRELLDADQLDRAQELFEGRRKRMRNRGGEGQQNRQQRRPQRRGQ